MPNDELRWRAEAWRRQERSWRRLFELGHPPTQQGTLVDQLLLELVELLATPRDEGELALDVAERLTEDLAAPSPRRVAAMPLLAQRSARLLGLDDVAQLVERQAQQVLQAQDLLEALDIGLEVETVAAGVTLGCGSPDERAATAIGWPSTSP